MHVLLIYSNPPSTAILPQEHLLKSLIFLDSIISLHFLHCKRKDEDLIKLSLYVKKMRDKRSRDGLMWV